MEILFYVMAIIGISSGLYLMASGLSGMIAKRVKQELEKP
jgi:hypothetical protein